MTVHTYELLLLLNSNRISVCFSCDSWTGKCDCKIGWYGPTCSDPCPLDRFGKNCKEQCNCHKTAKCSSNDGSCTCGSGKSLKKKTYHFLPRKMLKHVLYKIN